MDARDFRYFVLHAVFAMALHYAGLPQERWKETILGSFSHMFESELAAKAAARLVADALVFYTGAGSARAVRSEYDPRLFTIEYESPGYYATIGA